MIKRILIALAAVAAVMALVISCAPPRTAAPASSMENEVIIPYESPDGEPATGQSDTDDIDELLPEAIEEEGPQSPALAYTAYADPFDPYDWTLRGLDEHSSPEDATAVFGQPTSESEQDGFLAYEYPWGGLTFSAVNGAQNLLLRGGYYTDSTYSGPRDLHVGDSLDKLTGSFPADFMREQNGSIVLYCANAADYDGVPEPPCGIMQYSGSAPSKLTVSAPVSPISSGSSGDEKLYLCVFTLADDSITRIEYSFSDMESLKELIGED